MRIIGGELRGRRIAAPPGRGTRPMLDRVREAMFATLAPWCGGARVLDLFAGSGSLGLEALSRGARRARLVERRPAAVALLRHNVHELGMEDRATVVQGDALAPAHWSVEGEGPDVVLFDPPYALMSGVETRHELLWAVRALVGETLAPEGVLVFHAPSRDAGAKELEADLAVAVRRYGSSALWYVQRPEGEQP